MKRVTFAGRRPSAGASTVDDWVQDRETPQREPTKRFTIDVPVSLHKRVKSQCAMQNLVMANVMRELLEQRFPMLAEEPERAGGTANAVNRKHDDTTVTAASAQP